MNDSLTVFGRSLCLFLLSIALCGCASEKYQYGVGNPIANSSTVLQNEVQFGGDHPRLDRVERVVQTPRKLVAKMFGNEPKTAGEEELLREESIEISREYLGKAGLQDVYIDVREYAPGKQWSRLKANDRISPIWKYTGGTLSVARYTLLPDRVLQRDSFDPFTNTISLNSTDPASALHESASAKEYRKQQFLGTYAVLQNAPVVPLLHQMNVSSDVLTYAETHEFAESQRKELYKSEYAELGAVAVSSIVPLADNSASPLLQIAGGAIGGVTGQAIASQQVVRNDEQEGVIQNDAE